MSDTPTQQPSPDYGEPWHEQTASMNKGVHWLNTEQFNRAVACVNACVSMADPAAEIQAMREAIEEVHKLLQSINLNDIFEDAINHAALGIAKLQPFIKS